MQRAASEVSRREAYFLLIDSIVPRPIALVTSRSVGGIDNAAPFSAFNYMGEDPPVIVLGLQVHGDQSARAGEIKDTTKNIHETGEFVVNLVDEAIAERMNVCAVDFPAGTDESAAAGLTLAPSVAVAPARIVESPIAMECRRIAALEFGSFRQVVVGEILWMHGRDDLIAAETLTIDAAAYRPVGRLFGSLYVRTNERFQLPMMRYAEYLERGPARIHEEDTPSKPRWSPRPTCSWSAAASWAARSPTIWRAKASR